MNLTLSKSPQARTVAQSSTKGRIDFLDYLRIFAFVSVLVGHKYMTNVNDLATNPAYHKTIRTFFEYLVPLFQGGAAGVTVFFLISGYIITHVLESERAGIFTFRRLFRIYPLYVAAVLIESTLGYFYQGIAFPSLGILVPRLLLVGDFFDTPYALAGVEWSLRVEVLFYLFMAVLKGTSILNRPSILPGLFALCTVALQFVKPFPNFAGWSDGYVNLYGPFLFIGSIVYLLERKSINVAYCFASMTVIFAVYLIRLPKLHDNWKDTNAVALALLLFTVVYVKRHAIVGNVWILRLSNLTYGVYLFHNWLLAYLTTLVSALGVVIIPPDLQALVLLLIFCSITHITIEKGGVRLGRNLLRWLNLSPLPQLVPMT